MTKVAAVVGIAILMVLAPMAGVAGATTDEETQPEEVSLVSENNEYKVSDNVSVWKGSPISLRADLEEAKTSVELHNVRMQAPDGMEGDAKLKNAGVFGTGDIPLDLEEAYGPQISDYAGKDANLVVGQLDSEATIDDRELLTSFDRDSIDELNNNVEFEVESIELNSSGEFSGTYDADEAGQYVAFVATTDEDDNGFTIDEDEKLETNGETTILGVNGFMVHDESSNVEDPSSAELGDTLDFEADNIDTGESVEHGIALYHEDTFLDQKTIINVTEEPDSDNFSEDAIQLESSLKGVDGVTAIDNDSSLMGFTQDVESQTGQVNFESVLGLVSDQVDLGGDFNDDGAILDGSATVQKEESGNGTVEISVGTRDGWKEGDYQWIHIASDTNGETLITDEGMVSIEKDSGGGGGGGGGDDDGDDDDPAIPSAGIDIIPKSPSVNEDVTFSGTESTVSDSSDTDEITDYEWEIDGESFSGEEVTTSFNASGDYEVKLTVTSADGETDTTSTTVTIQPDSGDDDDDTDTGDEDPGDDPGSDTGDADPGDDDSTDGDDDGESIPGFGVMTALTAVLSAALVVTRIRR